MNSLSSFSIAWSGDKAIILLLVWKEEYIDVQVWHFIRATKFVSINYLFKRVFCVGI